MENSSNIGHQISLSKIIDEVCSSRNILDASAAYEVLAARIKYDINPHPLEIYDFEFLRPYFKYPTAKEKELVYILTHPGRHLTPAQILEVLERINQRLFAGLHELGEIKGIYSRDERVVKLPYPPVGRDD